jgi:hypothetical protein
MTERDYEGARSLVSVLLLCFVAAVAAYLWLADMFSGQRTFGVLMSAVLLGFSMLVYVYRQQSYGAINKLLLMLGYLALAILLSLSVAITMGYVA